MEGPFYRPGAPLLAGPYWLVRRPGERGAVLFVSGTVSATDGQRLPGAVLDVWQASAEGRYSPGAEPGAFSTAYFDPAQPPFNLRGRFPADRLGGFEVRTVVPGAYHDPPGSLSERDIRPAHLHVRITHPGFRTLTTQIFFAEDPYLDHDPAQVVRPSLVTTLERRFEAADLAARGLVRPYFACRYHFVLVREAAPPG